MLSKGQVYISNRLGIRAINKNISKKIIYLIKLFNHNNVCRAAPGFERVSL